MNKTIAITALMLALGGCCSQQLPPSSTLPRPPESLLKVPAALPPIPTDITIK